MSLFAKFRIWWHEGIIGHRVWQKYKNGKYRGHYCPRCEIWLHHVRNHRWYR